MRKLLIAMSVAAIGLTSCRKEGAPPAESPPTASGKAITAIKASYGQDPVSRVSIDMTGRLLTGHDAVRWREGDIVAFWELVPARYRAGMYGPALTADGTQVASPVLYELSRGAGETVADFGPRDPSQMIYSDKRYIAVHHNRDIPAGGSEATASGLLRGALNLSSSIGLHGFQLHSAGQNVDVPAEAGDSDYVVDNISFWSAVEFDTSGEEPVALPLSFRMADKHIQEFEVHKSADAEGLHVEFVGVELDAGAGVFPVSGFWAQADQSGELVFGADTGPTGMNHRGFVSGNSTAKAVITKGGFAAPSRSAVWGERTVVETTPMLLRAPLACQSFGTGLGEKAITVGVIFDLVTPGDPATRSRRVFRYAAVTMGGAGVPPFEAGKTYTKSVVLTREAIEGSSAYNIQPVQ